MEEMIYVIEINKTILNLNERSTKEELDRVDEIMTHMMNIV